MIDHLYDLRYSETAKGANPKRFLTHHLVLTERGLAVKATRTCSTDGCTGPHYGLGLCNSCYSKRRRAAQTATCSVDGCDKGLAGRGYCISHYSRWRRTGDPGPAVLLRQSRARCGVEGCDRAYQCSGYCALHRARWRRHGDPLIVLRPAVRDADNPLVATRAYGRTTCKVVDCTRPHEGHGYCARHRRRLRLYGDPLYEAPKGPRVALKGALNPSWKGNRAGYRAAHGRIFADRGRASRQKCLHCGGPAAEWAYFHADPDEMYAPGCGHYSLSPRFYEPLCSPCHRRYDAQWFVRFGYGRAVMASGHN